MLIFTNRITQTAANPSAFTRKFQPGSDALSAARVNRKGARFEIDGLQASLGDDDAMQLLVPTFQAARVKVVAA